MQELLDKYNSELLGKINIPAWLASRVKTPLSKNISILDWNATVGDIFKIASDTNSTVELLRKLVPAISQEIIASQNTANSAQNIANDALAAVPEVYFEQGFRDIVGACFSNSIKNGDVLINLNRNTPDFLVFAVNQFGTADVEVLTYDMVLSDALPTPSVGDMFLLQDGTLNKDYVFVPSGKDPQFGIVAIESGGLTATIKVDDKLSTTSTNPVQNNVISLALEGLFKSIDGLDKMQGQQASKIAKLENDKQDKLTFDNVPTQYSTNPVTSGGVHAEFVKFSGFYDTAIFNAMTEIKQYTDDSIKQAIIDSWEVGV